MSPSLIVMKMCAWSCEEHKCCCFTRLMKPLMLRITCLRSALDAVIPLSFYLCFAFNTGFLNMGTAGSKSWFNPIPQLVVPCLFSGLWRLVTTTTSQGEKLLTVTTWRLRWTTISDKQLRRQPQQNREEPLKSTGCSHQRQIQTLWLLRKGELCQLLQPREQDPKWECPIDAKQIGGR